MTLTDTVVDRLMDAGLTQYEARAYLVLRELGPARVTQIARASGVPRNKLYGALSQLEKMGLAEICGQTPLTYSTRSMSGYLRRRITRMELLLSELRAEEAENDPQSRATVISSADAPQAPNAPGWIE